MTEDEMREYQRKVRLYERRQSTFGEDAALYHYCFEEDNGSVPKMAEIRRYAEHFEEMRQENIGLLLWGQSGNGKTFAAACIANELCRQEKNVRMLTLGAMLTKLPGMTAQDKEQYLKTMTQCDLLIVDDFGMERRTEYAQEQVFALINGRYLTRKPLIVTTNLSLERLKTPVDITEQRIFDRVLEMCVPICFDGGSLRRQRGKEKIRRFLELTR